MRRVNLWLMVGAAVLVALAAAACARDASAPDDAAIPAAAAVGEGAAVRVAVREAIEVPRTGGPAMVQDLGETTREAVVEGGEAIERGSGAVLALAPGRGLGHRDYQYADDEGHRHRLVVDGTPGQGPLASVRYERDGEVVAEMAYRWEPRGDGYVLRERVLTLRKNGQVLLRHVRTAGAVDVTPGPAAGLAPLGTGGPLPPVQLTTALPCLWEWAKYLGASAALIVAAEVYTVMPSPASGAALLAAAGAWEGALDALLVCQVRNALGGS